MDRSSNAIIGDTGYLNAATKTIMISRRKKYEIINVNYNEAIFSMAIKISIF